MNQRAYDMKQKVAFACCMALSSWSIAQQAVVNREAVRPFFELAKVSRVDVVGVGDSNQIQRGNGWDEAWHVALDARFGLYATGVASMGESFGGGTGMGYRYSMFSSASSGQYAYRDAATPLAIYINNPPSVLNPNNYLYVAEGAVALGSGIQGFGIDPGCPIELNAPLRFHFSYGLFSGIGAGSFKPTVRFEAPPFETLVASPTISTRTGDASPSRVVFDTLDIPAGQRTRGISLRNSGFSETTVGPYISYYMRAENPLRSAGAAFGSLYAMGGQSARDMAQAFNLASNEHLTLYFTHVRATQGTTKGVLVRINSGLNDRAENLPSVGSGLTPGNTAAAYKDNVLFIMNRIRGIWTLNNWPEEELYFVLTPSHPVQFPDEPLLIEYRNACDQLAQSNPRTASVRLDVLTISPEMLASNWYQLSGTDRNHLNQSGYLSLAARELMYLLKTSCVGDFNSDGGIDGSDVESFFDTWESGDFLADVNEDYSVDGADIPYFLVRWSQSQCG